METRNINEIREELSSELDEDNPLSVQAMRLLVYGQMRKRQASGEPPLNCVVVDCDNKAESALFFDNLKKIASELAEPTRLQAIFKIAGHYTAIDIQLSKDGNKCFVLDAANDPRGLRHHFALKRFQGDDGKPFFAESYCAAGTTKKGNIQKDCCSCPAFALDHVCQVSMIDNMYAILREKKQEAGAVDWFDLPPTLVWNVQSMTMVEMYIEKNKQHEVEFRGHLMEESMLFGGERVSVNASAVSYFVSHQDEAILHLDRCDKNTLDKIINNYQCGLQLAGQSDCVKRNVNAEAAEERSQAPRSRT